jgi:hypothetical protein
MGSTSRYGRATINPSAPEAVGVCDRCGKLFDLRALRFQFDWAGTGMLNKQLRVCAQCYDQPQEQLRTIILPPDPPPVWQPRTEPYLVDELNEYTLRAAGLGVPMFRAASHLAAALEHGLGFAPITLDGVSDLAAFAALGAHIAPAADGVSDVTAAAALGARLSPAADGVSDLAAVLTQVTPSSPATRTVTDSFSFLDSGSFSEIGVSIGTAAADRLVVVTVAALNVVSVDGFDSVTIGGVAATLAIESTRTTGVGESFCSIYWANVPTGTTATIDFVFTGDDIYADVEVYRVVGADTVTPVTDTGTGSVASGNISDSVTIGDDSVTFSVTQDGANTGAAGTTVWTNITEDRDGGVDVGGVFVTASFASREDISGPGATTITAAVTGEDVYTDKTLAIAVMAP